MKAASHDLYGFLYHALKGLCDYPEKVHVTVMENAPNGTILIIDVAPQDLRFVYARFSELKNIARSIARRHKSFVELEVIEDEE